MSTAHAGHVTLDYIPRQAFVPFHQREQRFASLVCHRRAGKTVACVNDLVAKAVLTKKKNARYAYVAPFYRQAKDVAWTYLKDATKDIAIKIREADLRVELPNGAWITLYGADNPDTLRGLYFDGIILDEFGDCRPSLWAEVVLPTLLDRKGWAVFIGTPKGRNHFYHMNERAKAEANWFQMTLQASTSNLISPEDLRELAGQMTPDQYEQEMECSFEAAVRGTFYSDMVGDKERDGSIANALSTGYCFSFGILFACEEKFPILLVEHKRQSGFGDSQQAVDEFIKPFIVLSNEIYSWCVCHFSFQASF